MDLTYSIETPLLILFPPPAGLRNSIAYCRVETAERHIRWTLFAACVFVETVVVVVVVSVAEEDC